MKVNQLFFFSFVLASATLFQHGAKLPLTSKVMPFMEKIFFSRRFLLLKVYKFHHPILVLNAFPAISEAFKLLKNFLI